MFMCLNKTCSESGRALRAGFRTKFEKSFWPNSGPKSYKHEHGNLFSVSSSKQFWFRKHEHQSRQKWWLCVIGK